MILAVVFAFSSITAEASSQGPEARLNHAGTTISEGEEALLYLYLPDGVTLKDHCEIKFKVDGDYFREEQGIARPYVDYQTRPPLDGQPHSLGSMTFLRGGLTVGLHFYAQTDDQVEDDETATVTLQEPQNRCVRFYDGENPVTTLSATITIKDSPPTPEVTITAGSGITEGGPATFTISASPAPASPIAVNIGVSQTGSWGATGPATVSVSAATTTYAITTSDDNVDEANGSVTATVQSGSGYTVGSPSSGTVAVSDDDVPEVTITAGSGITEGGPATFTISASPAPASPIAVNIGVSQTGSWGATGPATVSVSAATTTYAITTSDDNVDEANGSVTATVQSGSGYTVGSPSSGTVAVSDDDVPEVTITAGSGITEGGPATFTISASPAPASPIAVNIGVSQTGSWGATGPATVSVSAATTTYAITTSDDNVDEANGSVTATVQSGSGYTVGSPSSGTVAVSDDDVPEVTITAGSGITEGGPATFTISASPAPASPIAVNIGVSQTGSWGATGPATVSVSAATTTYAITTSDDNVDEANGSVTATVQSGSGYTVGSPSSGTVAVSDDDVPEVTITAGSGITEGGPATFTISASPAPASPIAVNIGVSQTGSWGATGPATVSVSAATTTYAITTSDDNVDEANGSVTATVQSGSGYTVGSPSSGTVAVSDDDASTSQQPPQQPPQNNPPSNQPPTLTGDTTLHYAENGTTPVATYSASDPENANIAWSLSGRDGADFSIIRGDLSFNAGPDYEDPTDANTDNVYHVTVEASDGTNTVTLVVTVTVTNVNEPPQFSGNSTTRSADDGTGAGENIGAPVQATDPEGDALTYSLSGSDASSFSFATSTGQLTTKSALDRASKASYSVTVSASDGKDTDGNSDAATDDTIDVTIIVNSGNQGATSSGTTLLQSIPRQFVPVNGGAREILLSDHFSDSDDGYPPYQVTISGTNVATVDVSEGYLVITPQGIGVATTTLTVSDSQGIREEFKTIVYRPVLPRTNTETVYIVDPEVETTLTSSDGSLSVAFPAGAKDQFFQAAIDALSNDCGGQSPVGERRLCILVDLFDLGAESIEESLDSAATLSVSLTQQQYDAVQADLASDSFTMWKGHGPTDTSWDQIPQCAEPRGSSECYGLTRTSSGGKITVFNIRAFSRFDAGLILPDPAPQPPQKPSPPTTPTASSGGSGSGGASRSDDSHSTYSSGPTLRILGPVSLDYPENGTDAVARYAIEDSDVEEVIWSVYGERRPFTISSDGVLSFRSPPDYENLSTLEGDTYWVQVHAEVVGSPRRDDVLNSYVTVTQVNELGAISGDVELSAPENHTGEIARYEVDDPERGVITWSLTGPDAHGFEIDSEGNLSSVGVLDFEAPSGSERSNVHTLTITATDDGEPELSAQVDVTVTVGDVNEAPVARVLPEIDLTTGQTPLTLDLGEFFTDPDGDSLTFGISGESNADVAVATVDGNTLSIVPVGGGSVSLEVGATDPGGLRAASVVGVSVTEPPKPDPSPVPEKVIEPVLTGTPEPAFAGPLMSPLSERRYRNLTQQSDGVSKVVVGFAIEPVESHQPELALPPLEPTPGPAGSLRDDESATEGKSESETALPMEAGEAGWRLSLWVMVLLSMLGLAWVGFAVKMVVIHRVSLSIWQEFSRLRHRLPSSRI